MPRKSISSTKVKRFRPIYLLLGNRIIHQTTRSRTLEHAKKRYCEQNEIGGAEALRLSAKTLDQIREMNNVT